jgi:protein-S-isoprenylcysteine O-methyltransferase Ste14
MPPRVRAHPFLTLLAVISAVLILVGRINHDASWGDWVFIAGIVVLVVAGALFVLQSRR